jgi:hypothetical protein
MDLVRQPVTLSVIQRCKDVIQDDNSFDQQLTKITRLDELLPRQAGSSDGYCVLTGNAARTTYRSGTNRSGK